MALRYVTMVRMRACLLIAVTGVLLGLLVYILVGRAWDRSFAQEATAAARSIAAVLEWDRMRLDFVCGQMPMGNVQWVRIEQPGWSIDKPALFDSRTCSTMRYMTPHIKAVVRRAGTVTAGGDSVTVAVGVWDPGRERLAREVAGFMLVLCGAAVAFVFVVSMALQLRYRAGIRAVTSQIAGEPGPASAGATQATFAELADMAHIFRIVRESLEHDVRSARESWESEAHVRSAASARWESAGFRVDAGRIGHGNAGGLAWAWCHEASLHVLLARFAPEAVEGASDFGALWRQTVVEQRTGEQQELLDTFQPEGHLYCVWGPGEDVPRTVSARGMTRPAVARHGGGRVLLSTAAHAADCADMVWVAAARTGAPVTAATTERRKA